MGKKRGNVLNIVIISLFLLLLLPFIIGILFKEYELVTIMLAVLILIIFLLMFLNIFYAFYRKINKKKYGFRQINSKELDKLKNINLIHYSHILVDEEEGEREVSIPAHISPKVSYRLPQKYRKKGFVWFHVADGIDSEEPILNSYLSAHWLEGDSMKQKIVIKIEDLPKHRMFVEVNSGFLLVKGDLTVKAKVYHNFKWYNEKIYVPFIIKTTIKTLLTIFYAMYHQVKVELEEFLYHRKNKKKEEVKVS